MPGGTSLCAGPLRLGKLPRESDGSEIHPYQLVSIGAAAPPGMNRGDRLQTHRGNGLHINWGVCTGKMSYQWNRNNDLLIWKCDAQSPRQLEVDNKSQSENRHFVALCGASRPLQRGYRRQQEGRILNEMRSISQEVLLKSAPGTRKKSSCKIIPKGS